MKDQEIIILKGTPFIIPEKRRRILTTWISDKVISEENEKFEALYNTLPDIEEYIPLDILENSVASIVVRTKGNKVIKNAELSYENKSEITSVFSYEKHNDAFLKYDVLENSLLICDYLEGFENMRDLSDGEMFKFIEGITLSINRMINEHDEDILQIESKYIPKLCPTGYNVHFPKFLTYAIETSKVTNQIADRLLTYHHELNTLPKQIIHGDLSRANVMYKDNQFIIIDPKINIGRPLEDLAKFILKSRSKENGEETIKLVSKVREFLAKTDFEEFKKWIYIYTVSVYSEYIHTEKTDQSKLIVEKIDRMFRYILDTIEIKGHNNHEI